jgi:hypothetical protein
MMVFVTMGPNLTTFLQKRPEFQIGEPWEQRFTKTAKPALSDTLQTLHLFHKWDAVYRDLHLGNIHMRIE